jgi:hypothetical protein
MNAAPAGPPIRKWTWVHWTAATAIVFLAHVALIYLFSNRQPPPAPPIRKVPSLALTDESSGDLLSLNSATLFALPDRNGFAGLMWTALPPLPFTRLDWTEPPRFLPMLTNELGAGLSDYVQTNKFAGIHFEFNLPPPLAIPAIPVESPFDTNSTLQVQGEIVARPLRNSVELPLWPRNDVIAPSVVQVLVNAAGNVVSAVLLPPENLSDSSATQDIEANQYAVRVARGAQFAPLTPTDASVEASPAAHLAIGQLVFNWQTVPVITTNALK